MKTKALIHMLLMWMVGVCLLAAASGNSQAATFSPTGTPPSVAKAPSPVAGGASALEPTSTWTASELDPIVIPGGWSCVVRVWVQGQVGLPVTIRAADGSWSTTNVVGTKPEYGPDALEFAPVWPGRYIVTPEGLGVSLTFDLASGHIAQVRFEPGGVPGPAPTPAGQVPAAPKPMPSPTPLPTAVPTPALPPLSAPDALAPAPTLVEPPDGTAVSLKIRLDLAWTWTETLGPDDYFQVEIWNSSNDFSTPIDVAWVKDLVYRHDGNFNIPYGPEYRWKVTVVRGIPPREKGWSTPDSRVWDPTSQYIPISQESEFWILIVDPGCSPGDRNC